MFRKSWKWRNFEDVSQCHGVIWSKYMKVTPQTFFRNTLTISIKYQEKYVEKIMEMRKFWVYCINYVLYYNYSIYFLWDYKYIDNSLDVNWQLSKWILHYKPTRSFIHCLITHFPEFPFLEAASTCKLRGGPITKSEFKAEMQFDHQRKGIAIPSGSWKLKSLGRNINWTLLGTMPFWKSIK